MRIVRDAAVAKGIKPYHIIAQAYYLAGQRSSTFINEKFQTYVADNSDIDETVVDYCLTILAPRKEVPCADSAKKTSGLFSVKTICILLLLLWASQRLT